MKNTFAALLLLFFAAPALRAGPHQPGSQKLTVVYQNWQHFTDIKDQYEATPKGEWNILENLRRSLEDDAHYDVPDGDHLTMTFTDIDLAGDFEPWRGGEWDQVRIVKDIYPPRFKFTYQLTDPSGRVIKQGSENIVDLDFQDRVVLDQSDPLRYEKDILKEWMDGKIGR